MVNKLLKAKPRGPTPGRRKTPLGGCESQGFASIGPRQRQQFSCLNCNLINGIALSDEGPKGGRHACCQRQNCRDYQGSTRWPAKTWHQLARICEPPGKKALNHRGPVVGGWSSRWIGGPEEAARTLGVHEPVGRRLYRRGS